MIADGGVVSDGGVVGDGVGVGVGVRVVLVFGGSGDGKTGAIDGADGAGVDGAGAAQAPSKITPIVRVIKSFFIFI